MGLFFLSLDYLVSDVECYELCDVVAELHHVFGELGFNLGDLVRVLDGIRFLVEDESYLAEHIQCLHCFIAYLNLACYFHNVEFFKLFLFCFIC